MKWNIAIESISAEQLVYVNYFWCSGVDEETAWQVARQVASWLQYMGIQDASRKIKPPGVKTNSAWEGTIFYTTLNKLFQTVYVEKWNRGKGLVKELYEVYVKNNEESPYFNFKQLEGLEGFYVSFL